MTLSAAADLQQQERVGRSRAGLSERVARVLQRTGISFLVGLCAFLLALPLIPLQSPNQQDLMLALQGPSGDHWLGTDEVGRDSLSRLLHGARTTLLASFFAVGVCAAIGLPLGLLAGRVGGWFDALVSRLADAIMSVPPLILLMAVIAALGQGIWSSMAILGVIIAPRLFRVTRAATINLASAEFISVGEMSGCGRGRIMYHYIFRNITDQVMVQVTILLGYAILTEASISFLGLGVHPPNPSLGGLLRSSMEYIAVSPILVLAPGLLISVVILACNLTGDTLANRGGVK